MHPLIQKLKASFVQEGIEPNTPATLVDIKNFEKTYQVRLSPILIDYFLYVNGIQEYMFGNSGLSFYSLDRFKPLSFYLNEGDADDYLNDFVFADMLLWSWGYALQLNPDRNAGQVSIICADSNLGYTFEAFLQHYLQNGLMV